MKFNVGNLLTGKELKERLNGQVLCKVLRPIYNYKRGRNLDENNLDGFGFKRKEGFRFCAIKDVCYYLFDGGRMALINIDDDEVVEANTIYDVNGNPREEFHSKNIIIKKVFYFNKLSTWEYLCHLVVTFS